MKTIYIESDDLRNVESEEIEVGVRESTSQEEIVSIDESDNVNADDCKDSPFQFEELKKSGVLHRSEIQYPSTNAGNNL